MTALIRIATPEERAEIAQEYIGYEGSGHSLDDLPEFDVYVREHYVSDSPGYTGTVAFMHWHGGPHLITILLFEPAGAGYAWRVNAETSDINLVSDDDATTF